MIIKPPDRMKLELTPGDGVFLAGSIEMGEADEWQTPISEALDLGGWTVFNPRRDNWDSTWVQSEDNLPFLEQVTWELDMLLNKARAALFYFQPGTKAPITLMELGLCAERQRQQAVVVCPEGFWRKGNVDIVARRYGMTSFTALKPAVIYLVELRKRQLEAARRGPNLG